MVPALLYIFSLFVQPGNLVVVIKGVEVGKGAVVVSVFGDAESFLKTPIVSQRARADAPEIRFTFSVPAGTRAVAAYQDVNANGKLDYGLFHIPQEPYGFSNGYRPSFSAPHYDGCAIAVGPHTIIDITLK